MDGEKTIEALKNLEEGKAQDMHQDMKNLAAYLNWFSPSFIRCPFKAVGLKVSNDRSKLLISDSTNSLALLKRQEQETALQKTLKNLKISSVEVPKDQKYILIGDKSGTLFKLDGETFDIQENFKIADSKLSCMLNYNEEDLIIGTNSGDLFQFSLNLNQNPRKIFKFDSEITSMACSDTRIAVSTSKGMVQIFTSGLGQLNQYDLGVKITSIKLIKDYFAVAFDSEVRILSCDTGEEILQFAGHKKTVNCMEVYNDLLITGSADQMVKVWRTDKWCDEVTLFGHSAPVINLIVIDNIIHSLDSNGTILASRCPSFPYMDKFRLTEIASFLVFAQKLNSTLGVTESGSIYNLTTTELFYETSTKSSVIAVDFTRNSEILIIFQEKNRKSCHVFANLIELDNKNSQQFLLRTSSLPQACTCTKEFKYIITGEIFRITIWRAADGIQEYIFCTHNTKITSIICAGSKFFAADASGITKQYELDTFDVFETINETDEKIVKQLNISPDSKLLFVLSGQKTLRVLDVNKKMTVFENEFSDNVSKIEFQPDYSHFFVVIRKGVEVWNCQSWTKNFAFSFTEKILSFSVDPWNKKLLCVFNGYYKVLDNPFDAQVVTVFGDFRYSHFFMDHLAQVFKGFKPKFFEKFSTYAIEPFNFNLLHIYAYFNLYENIEEALKSGCSFFSSRLGYDPIQIALEKHHTDSLKALTKNLIPILNQSPHMFCHLSKTITSLNHMSLSNLHQIYESSFVLSKDLSIPHFCKENMRLPIFLLSSDTTLSVHQALPNTLKNEGRAVDFYQSFLPLNYITGSNESVEFLKSLVACKQLGIFNSLYLKVLLEFKWRKVRWIHLLDCILYVVYLVCLILGVFRHELHHLLFISFGVNQVLFIYEFVQMLAAPRIYFHSFTNYVDMVRGIIFNLYCALEYLNIYEKHQNLLFLLTLFISIFRAYGYFRIFKSTRWLIYLVLDIINQLWSFIAVTVYAIISLWVLYFAMENTIDLTQHNDLKMNIMLFFFILIINPLILINLFINIIGNSLEKIQDEKEVKDLQEVAEMVFEAETMMIWRRGQKNKSFLQICITEQETVKNTNSITEKIIKAAETVEKIKEQCIEETDELKELRKTIEYSLSEIENKVKAMRVN